MDVVEEVLIELEQLVGACQEVNHVQEQVVEVHCVGAAERALVEVVDRRDVTLAGGYCTLGIFVGHDEVIFCAGDRRAYSLGRELFGVNVLLLEKSADERERIILVVNREVGGKSQMLSVPAEESREDGVERPSPDTAGRPHIAVRCNAVAELIGGFISERHRDDTFWRNTVCNQECYACRQNTSLTTASTGDDQDRPFGRCDCLTLLSVELGKKVLDGAHTQVFR